jgi:hypothetical protein
MAELGQRILAETFRQILNETTTVQVGHGAAGKMTRRRRDLVDIEQRVFQYRHAEDHVVDGCAVSPPAVSSDS